MEGHKKKGIRIKTDNVIERISAWDNVDVERDQVFKGWRQRFDGIGGDMELERKGNGTRTKG